MDETATTLWHEALDVLKRDTDHETLARWFGAISRVGGSRDRIVVYVPNDFLRQWLLDHYADRLRVILAAAARQPVQLAFEVAGAPTPPPPPAAAPPARSAAPGLTDGVLNARYTFDAFVIGSSNRFAHAASVAVAESPARAYNPLFLYGGVGLGKTHLMQAIGHSVLAQHGGTKVVYISSERFTNQLITAIQTRTTQAFRARYRSVDMLLLDDVHFIAGKESTQEEFFHTFNALYDAHKQIVLSSDRAPKHIALLEERLVSRFGWGLVADIQPPSLETRIAILREKARRQGIEVAPEVVEFIAQKVSTNIRELEGALMRVVAYGALTGTPMTVTLAGDVLRDLVRDLQAAISVDLIQRRVADYFQLRPGDLRAKSRSHVITYPRHLAIYLCRQLTRSSLTEIGASFGGRDHTTVLHACQRIGRDLQTNGELRKAVEDISEGLKAAKT